MLVFLLVKRLGNRVDEDRGRRMAQSRPIRVDYALNKRLFRFYRVFLSNLLSLKMLNSNKGHSFLNSPTLHIPIFFYLIKS